MAFDASMPCAASILFQIALKYIVQNLKGLTQTAAESSGSPIQTWGNYHLGYCYTRARTFPSTCIRLERFAARIACITHVFRSRNPENTILKRFFSTFVIFWPPWLENWAKGVPKIVESQKHPGNGLECDWSVHSSIFRSIGPKLTKLEQIADRGKPCSPPVWQQSE